MRDMHRQCYRPAVRFLALLLLASGPVCAQLDKSIGVLRTQGTVGCLMIRNGSLQPGTPITVLRNFFDTSTPPTRGLNVGKRLAAD